MPIAEIIFIVIMLFLFYLFVCFFLWLNKLHTKAFKDLESLLPKKKSTKKDLPGDQKATRGP